MSEIYEDYDEFRKSSLSNYKQYKKLSAAPRKASGTELELQPTSCENSSPQHTPRYFLRFNNFCDLRESTRKMPRNGKRGRTSPDKSKKSPVKSTTSPPQPPEKKLHSDKTKKVEAQHEAARLERQIKRLKSPRLQFYVLPKRKANQLSTKKLSLPNRISSKP